VITARYVLCPYRDLPLSVVLPDEIVATAKSSSMAANMAVFMMIVVLSGQQTE